MPRTRTTLDSTIHSKARLKSPRRQSPSSWRQPKRQPARPGRVVVAGIGALLLLIAGGVAIGWYLDNVVQASAPVAIVYGQPITAADLADRVRLAARSLDAQARLEGGSLLAYASELDLEKRKLPASALDDLIEERIVQHEADARGISLTPPDLAAHMRQTVAELQASSTVAGPATGAATGAAATLADVPQPPIVPVPTAVATLEPTAYRDALATQLLETGLTEIEYRQQLTHPALKAKLQESFEPPNELPQEEVHARDILTRTEPAGLAAVDRLNHGESFEAVVRDVSIDPGSKDRGGDLGWLPAGLVDETLNAALFQIPVGKSSRPFQTSQGWHILEILDRDQSHTITADQQQVLANKGFDDWLSEVRQDPTVVIPMLGADSRNWVLRHIGVRP